jgi:hypothetical protein
MLLGLANRRDVRQFGGVRALIIDHLAEQAGVSGVVFDQQDFSDSGPIH